MENAEDRRGKTALPAKPPDGLVPEGYRKKVLFMWLSFFCALLGLANLGGPLWFILPLSLAVLAVDLIFIIFGRMKDRPVWLYKEAYESYSRRRYDKALKKLLEIIELRPDMEGELLPAIMICKRRTGDFEGAYSDLQRLISEDRIAGDSNPVVLIEALSLLRKAREWDRIIETADYIPRDRLYSDYYNYYLGIALAETGEIKSAAEYLEMIEEDYRFPDIEDYINMTKNN